MVRKGYCSMRWIAAVFSILVSCCGVSAQPDRSADHAFSQAVPICTVIANAKAYDGQSVLVRGLYRAEPHGGIFYGASCSQNVVRLRWSSRYVESEEAKPLVENSLNADDTKPIEVAYGAVFHVIPGLQCSVARCFRYEIETSRLVAARRQ